MSKNHELCKDAILTAEEVAEYLKINKRTVYNLAEKGEIPGVKLGRQWRFKKRMIEEIFSQPKGHA